MTNLSKAGQNSLKSKKEKINYLIQSVNTEKQFYKEKIEDIQTPERLSEPKSKISVNFPPLEDRLTQKEVAQLFGKSVQTIINWKHKKIIPFFLLGKYPIYSRSQLIELASRNQHLMSDNSKL